MENKMNVWWKNAVGYQINLKSFYDSNGDGIGDLNGVIEKLEYIRSIGVDFVWICPFYDSPMDDNGYDVRDYKKVYSDYGNIEVFRRLVEKSHNLGLKVVIDFVINHTSSEHEWFVKSEDRQEPYSDYYYWKDGKVGKDGKIYPPNDWLSFFGGTAWSYSEKRMQYYLRIFSATMPDLNLDSENVIDALGDVINFWKDLGVDGFRVDAISHIGKRLDFKDVKNINKFFKFYSNQPNSYDYLNKLDKYWNDECFVKMGEMGGDPTFKQIVALGDKTKKRLNMTFDFVHMGTFCDGKINVKNLFYSLKHKVKVCDKNGWSALFWFNHDYPRFNFYVSRLSNPDFAQSCLAGIMYFLKGTPIIYNGEEIGMINYPFKEVNELVDVKSRQLYETSEDKEKTKRELLDYCRDNSRTMMQWDSSKNAGFSSGRPWFVVNPNYEKINVFNQERDEHSMLSCYKRMFETRKKVLIDVENAEYSFFRKKNVIGYDIKTGGQKYRVIANLSDTIYSFDGKFDVLFSNIGYNFDNELSPYEINFLKFK